jgi:hypothetical protein
MNRRAAPGRPRQDDRTLVIVNLLKTTKAQLARAAAAEQVHYRVIVERALLRELGLAQSDSVARALAQLKEAQRVLSTALA